MNNQGDHTASVHWWATGDVRVGYAVAVVATLLCTIVRAAAEPLLPDDAPLLLLPAVVAAALVGGLIPGLCATLLCAVPAAAWFLQPFGDGAPGGDQLKLAIFITMGVTISVIAGLLWRTVRRLRTTFHSLRNSEQQLHDLMIRREQLLLMFAHELRAPLEPTTNAVELLSSERSSAADRGWALDVLRRQFSHFSELVDALVETAELAGHQPRLRRRVFDLRDVLRYGVDTQNGAFSAAGITLDYQAPEQPLWIDGDRARLRQLIVHLLNNARQYTGVGGRVTVSARADGDRVRLDVSDTGIGIAADLLGELFDAFRQSEQSLARSDGGLGLGLASVRQIATLHGGSVSAASDGPDRGATLTVCLPLVDGPNGEDAAAGETALSGRLLIIDDNVDTAATLRRLAEYLGFETRVETEGAAGIEAARLFLPHVVICDIGLPDVDGYEVARTLRADARLRGVRLIALTGYGGERNRRRALDAGFDIHLTKPADVTRLRGALSSPAH